ncbi:response regulator [Roseateles sp. DAIF2]|uniref:MHYT domain-containing protein n=1 Tax=Roseateles sp. DAIF2 TaxID=2714952 RepID=UPI0018A2C93E|nr:MHYT domain-containing protein [Roseateles sp. DAIF2]QPF75952.1 response regulator [Roseateles sp. DAIF2]
MLNEFFLFRDGAPTLLLVGSHQPWLVALSVGVAALTSALALQMAGMAKRAEGRAQRHAILASGAAAMGGGVWSMHFIGMLAFQLCAGVRFDTGLTLLSALPALLASWVALALLSQGRLGRWQWVMGGVLVGAGIGSMHYIGMAAMELNAELRYDPLWFAASIVVAVLLAMLALWIRFGLEGRLGRLWTVLLGGLVMGGAISGMHYTAMGAARFIGSSDEVCDTVLGSNGALALGVTLVTLAISLLTAGTHGLLSYRRLNRRLRDSEQQYRSLIDNSPGVNFRCRIDADWSMLLISDSVQTLTGWPAQDFLAGRASFAPLIHLEDRERVNAEVTRALAADEPYKLEYRLHTREGVERWVSETGRGVRDESGALGLIDGVILDISEAKRLQLDLQEAKGRAEAAAAAKSAFLANMSHEIRTPMNAVLGFTELLLDTTLSESQRKHLNTVRGSARSLLGLLNDILDTAKLDKGAVELERRDFSLRAVCEQTLASLRLAAERKGLELRLDYPAEAPQFFQGDALRVQQVLVNLVGNAIKFTERGSVTLRLRIDAADGAVHLAVIDTGIGIAPDRLERIFDAFAQADASTTRRFGGTGLGTTISRQLVERMGGRIRVESQIGAGSCFHVHLPLPPGAPVAAVVETPDAATTLPPLRLLVADDVAQNGELMQLLLGRDGHRVRLVGDGLQALQAFGEEEFDAVLMDVHMPELDGLGATRRIRKFELSEARPRTPIIALTASVLEEDRQAALAAGMDGFAAKPVEPARLRAELARVLGLSPGAASGAALAMPSAQQELVDIDCEQGLQLWGSAGAWQRALRRFAVEQRDGAARLLALLHAREWLEARALVHRWRGVAGSLALPRLLAATLPLEEALRQGRQEPELSALGEALAGALREVLAAIAEQAAAGPASAPAPLEAMPPVAPASLDRLERALQHGELDDAAFAELQQHLGQARCAALAEALDQFDFEAALRALQALKQAAGSSSS